MRADTQEYNELLEKLYHCTDKGARVALLPVLDPTELEQLKQLFHPRWDGNVMTKFHRDMLVRKGCVERWNGMNFISKLGMIVLNTLGFIDEDWERKVHKNCIREHS